MVSGRWLVSEQRWSTLPVSAPGIPRGTQRRAVKRALLVIHQDAVKSHAAEPANAQLVHIVRTLQPAHRPRLAAGDNSTGFCTESVKWKVLSYCAIPVADAPDSQTKGTPNPPLPTTSLLCCAASPSSPTAPIASVSLSQQSAALHFRRQAHPAGRLRSFPSAAPSPLVDCAHASRPSTSHHLAPTSPQRRPPDLTTARR